MRHISCKSESYNDLNLPGHDFYLKYASLLPALLRMGMKSHDASFRPKYDLRVVCYKLDLNLAKIYGNRKKKKDKYSVNPLDIAIIMNILQLSDAYYHGQTRNGNT